MAGLSSSPAANSTKPTIASLLQWWAAADVVCASDTRCCCFTKSYSRFLKGTGSLFCEKPPTEFMSAKASREVLASTTDSQLVEIIHADAVIPTTLKRKIGDTEPMRLEKQPRNNHSLLLKAAILKTIDTKDLQNAQDGDGKDNERMKSSTIDELDLSATEREALASIRYFTPREVANLHSFPSSFDFPEEISNRQRYALLGNSLSVAVVSCLLKYLLSSA